MTKLTLPDQPSTSPAPQGGSKIIQSPQQGGHHKKMCPARAPKSKHPHHKENNTLTPTRTNNPKNTTTKKADPQNEVKPQATEKTDSSILPDRKKCRNPPLQHARP